MYYIDNIRVYLTVLVILHHVAVAYGGSGGWPIKEPATDAVSPIIFLLFNALNQSYFMSFFFILAGYFTPRSLERKGGASFIKDRLVRLEIRCFSS
jgi:peptidoglycan/LPS O-acetylase OafA/YrhL